MFQLRIERCERTIDLKVSSHDVVFEHIFDWSHVLSISTRFITCLIWIFRYLLQVFVGDDIHVLFAHFDEIIIVSMYRRVALQFAHSESWFLHVRGLLTIMESLRFWSIIFKMDVVYRFWVSAGWAFVFVFEIFVIQYLVLFGPLIVDNVFILAFVCLLCWLLILLYNIIHIQTGFICYFLAMSFISLGLMCFRFSHSVFLARCWFFKIRIFN